MKKEAIDKLTEIGLNQLEAEVYYLLLREKPMTAYKAGKLLKKPTANVYKAVDVLYNKGAVIIEEGQNKLCKAVDPEEFLAIQENQFSVKTREASKLLSNIKPKVEAEKTYSLDSVDLALEKARKMIDTAVEIVVVDAFPLALEAIIKNVKSAVERGVEVVVQAYNEIEIEGADLFVPKNSNEVVSYWHSQQLNVVVDGNASLVALFDKDLSDVYHATWSENVYLSCIIHAGRICEQTIHKLMAVSDSEEKLLEIEEILKAQRFLSNSNVPGIQTLFERHMSGEKSNNDK